MNAAITRALTLLYTLSLLTLLTRIQLNLLGRRNYISSVAATAAPQAGYSGRISLQNNDDGTDFNTFGNDFNTNRKYLTFSWWLLQRGYKDIMELVSNAVKDVFGPIPPTEVLTPTRLSSLILQVRQKVEGTTDEERNAKRWLPYVLPPQDQESIVLVESGVITPPSETAPPSSSPSTAILRRLLDETADLVDSPPFNRIQSLLLDALFTHLIDVQVLQQAFPPSPPHAPLPKNDPSSSVTIVPAHPSEPRTKLANILAVLTRQAHAIGDSPSTTTPPSTAGLTTSGMMSTGNGYVDAISSEVGDLESFAAVIYAGNLQQEGEELGNAMSQKLPAEMSSDSLTENELREGLGLESISSNEDDAQSQLEKVWGRAKELAGR